MNWKRAISLGLATILSVGTLAGCGGSDDPLSEYSKAEVIQMYRDLEYEKNDLQIQIDEMNAVLSALDEGQAPTAAISSTGDGTGMTFNSYDAKIIFDPSFQYPGSQQVAASGSVNIVDNISITPGSNWAFKLNGSTLELSHTSNISGTIKVGAVTELYNKELLQGDVLAPWFERVPQSGLVYNNIFLNDTMWGVQATTPTTIDSEDAFLRVGMLAFGDYSVVYVFVYRGLQDVNKDESIKSLLNSMVILGQNFSVEQ